MLFPSVSAVSQQLTDHLRPLHGCASPTPRVPLKANPTILQSFLHLIPSAAFIYSKRRIRNKLISTFNNWFRSFLPFLSLWALLAIVWPLESIFLSQWGSEAAVVGSQLGHVVFFPLLAFFNALVQPLSRKIALIRAEESAPAVALKNIDREVSSYLSLVVVVALVAAALSTIRSLSWLFSDDAAIQAEFSLGLLWRLISIPWAVLAAVGDNIAFGKGRALYATQAVVVESVVYAAYLYGLGPLLLHLGLSPNTVAGSGLTLKFIAVVLFYLWIFRRSGLLRHLSWLGLGSGVRTIRMSASNGFISCITDVSRLAVGPVFGYIPLSHAATITLVDRAGSFIDAMAYAQRQYIFSRSSRDTVLARETLLSLLFSTALMVVIALPGVLLYTTFVSPIASDMIGFLALRMVVSFLFTAAMSYLTLLLLTPRATNKRSNPMVISAIANWGVWVPLVWGLFAINALTPFSYLMTLVFSLAVQSYLGRAALKRSL